MSTQPADATDTFYLKNVHFLGPQGLLDPEEMPSEDDDSEFDWETCEPEDDDFDADADADLDWWLDDDEEAEPPSEFDDPDEKYDEDD